MKKSMIAALFAAILASATQLHAQSSPTAPGPGDGDWLKNVWAIEVGFGEIPFLSGSFKPSVSFGYHINQYVYVGWVVQLRDILERGTESFNARNTGLGHITGTREVTGIRSLLGARIRPHRYAPFLSVGILFNGSDREEMRFGDAPRPIGDNIYEGGLTVVQTRPYAIRPALGLGYGVQFKNGFTFSAEMTGAFFLPAPSPDIQITHEGAVSAADKTRLASHMKQEFKANFHNRYHLFNIGAGYVW